MAKSINYKHVLFYLAALATVAGFVMQVPFNVSQAGSLQEMATVPAFTHKRKTEWINAEPMTVESLRGKVVMIDFWTYGCWNCYRSFPWLNDLEAKYKDKGLIVIGVHTPEFDHEHNRDNVVRKVKEFKLQHPVMIDNDFSYWRAMGNRYWPAYYIIDKQGRLRGGYVGETHAGDRQARAIESQIQNLLKEE